MEGIDIKDIPKNLIKHFEILKKFKDIQFVYLPKISEKPHDTLLIILNNNISLWFFKENDTWKYDGWEFGDYTKSWKDKRL